MIVSLTLYNLIIIIIITTIITGCQGKQKCASFKPTISNEETLKVFDIDGLM